MRKKLLVFGLAALVLLSVLLPVLHSTTSTTSTRGGRVFRFEGVVSVGKEPADDPWGPNSAALAALRYPQTFHAPLFVDGITLSSSSVTVTARAMSDFDMIANVTIISQFSISTQQTGQVRLRADHGGGYIYTAAVIPSRTWAPGTYRWVITIPSLNTPTFKHSVHIPHSSNRMWVGVSSYTPLCSWTSPGSGSSSSGLTFSTPSYEPNSTHLGITWRIQFGSEWNGRNVSECFVFTSDQNILSSVRSVTGAAFSSNRVYVLYVRLDQVVYSGDVLEAVVWYVAPANV